jgi:hypothetical protein
VTAMEMEKRTHFSIWYILAAIFFAFWIQSLFMAGHETRLAYSEFKKAVAARQIAQLSLGKEIIVGKLKVQGLERILSPDQMAQIRESKQDPHPFVTVRVEDPDLEKELQAAQIPYAGTLESTFLKNLLSCLWRFGGSYSSAWAPLGEACFPSARARRRSTWKAT